MTLSQELIDLIIDELSRDETALIKLSLISRSWVPRSRKHLFHILRLRPRPMSGNHRYLLRPFPTVEPHIQKFIELCSHPHSTIPTAGPTHVELTVCAYPMAHSSGIMETSRLSALAWLSERSEKPGGLTETNAHKLFWNVRHLTLSCPTRPGHSIEWLERVLLLSPFPRVTRLTINGEYPVFRTWQSFSDILSSFASLKQLSFGLAPIWDYPNTTLSFPPSLTHIEAPGLAISLPALKSCSTLQHLTLTIKNPIVEPLCTGLNQWLESSTAVKDKCLTHCKLVLRSEDPNAPGVVVGLSKLINFTKIQSWTIEAECKDFLGRDMATVPNVTTIVLRCWEILLIFPWMSTELDDLLSEGVRFPGLRDVKVVLYKAFKMPVLQKSDWDELERTVREGSEAHRVMDQLERQVRSKLPKCDKKGLLKMSYVYSPIGLWLDW